MLTHELCKKACGKLILRIDDIDRARVRDEYLEDIFKSLDWLGISYDQGPRGIDDFKKNFSQEARIEEYRSILQSICDEIYACICSRSDILKQSPSGKYPGTCLSKKYKYIPHQTCLRLKTNQELALEDFVVWTKEDRSSYHLMSVVEDERDQVDLIVRGEDLQDSSKAQLYLAQKLNFYSFLKAKQIHHPLVLSETGEKLSKSKGDFALKSLREKGVSAKEVWEKFFQFVEKNNLNYF